MLHVLDMSYSVIAPEDVVTALGEESCSWGYPQRLCSQHRNDPVGTWPEFSSLDQL